MCSAEMGLSNNTFVTSGSVISRTQAAGSFSLVRAHAGVFMRLLSHVGQLHRCLVKNGTVFAHLWIHAALLRGNGLQKVLSGGGAMGVSGHLIFFFLLHTQGAWAQALHVG